MSAVKWEDASNTRSEMAICDVNRWWDWDILHLNVWVTLKTREQHAKELDFKSQPPAGLAYGFKWWDSFHSMPGTYANCDATIWEDRWCTTLKCEADFLREHCNKNSRVNFSAVKVRALLMIFSQVHSPRWKWDHLQTNGGKVEIETTTLQTSGGKSTNTNLPCEKTCISSEIFLKSWSFIWTFQSRLFRDSKSLREHLQFSALKWEHF